MRMTPDARRRDGPAPGVVRVTRRVPAARATRGGNRSASESAGSRRRPSNWLSGPVVTPVSGRASPVIVVMCLALGVEDIYEGS